ncbi:MAG: universal stress protein [Chloroflexi bacterium]|nr:universal stress protein [Chloroflexota bacterium]
MFRRLLLPLDGSRLAEAVLPIAVYFAERFHATLVLFHALEQAPPATVHGQRHLMQADEARVYLKEVEARIARPGLTVERDVHPAREEDVAGSILEHVGELDSDLVVLCAHGRGGLRDVLIGSLAQQVISRGATPVLFVRPRDIGAAGSSVPYITRKILVPLDSAPVHEPALPVAEQVAQATGAALHLVTVVPTTGTLKGERAATGMLLPATTTAVLELAQRGAIEYLQQMTAHLLAQGLPATATVARGDPPAAIINEAGRVHADLIVMATHGRQSFDAFWSGSVTPKVLSKTNVPVLLVRVMGG